MNILNKSAESTNKSVKLIHAISKLCAVLLVGGSLFFFSVKTATANDTKKFNFPETLTEADKASIANSNGRYSMEITSVISSSNKSTWYILVYDTQTGRSKFYYGSVGSGTAVATQKFQLPVKPL